jgi:hypothetical protein
LPGTPYWRTNTYSVKVINDVVIAKIQRQLDPRSWLPPTWAAPTAMSCENIVLDNETNVYVVGWTFSLISPVAGDYICNQRVGTIATPQDCFVSRLNRDLSQLLDSTYLGGSQGANVNAAPSRLGGDFRIKDRINDIVLDARRTCMWWETRLPRTSPWWAGSTCSIRAATGICGKAGLAPLSNLELGAATALVRKRRRLCRTDGHTHQRDLGRSAHCFGTVDGTALAGTDYTATTGTLVFADGETTRPIHSNFARAWRPGHE